MNDLFIWQSVINNKQAIRDVVEGSNFIRCLVAGISTCGCNNDLYNLFVRVNSLIEHLEGAKSQKSPITQSSLYSSATKQFYFKTIEN